VEAEEEEPAAGDELRGVAEEDDVAAVEAIRGVAGGEHEDGAGKKEGEAGIAEVDGAMGELVDLPGDGDGLRLRAEDGEQPGELVAAKISMAEGRGGETVGKGHLELLVVSHFWLSLFR